MKDIYKYFLETEALTIPEAYDQYTGFYGWQDSDVDDELCAHVDTEYGGIRVYTSYAEWDWG